MNRAALSILVFGIYIFFPGVALLLAPDFLLSTMGMPPAQDVWPRVTGLALLALAFYYTQAARTNNRAFFAWTVPIRCLQFGVFVAFVLAGLGKPVLLLTSGLELLAGLWTWYELRRSA